MTATHTTMVSARLVHSIVPRVSLAFNLTALRVVRDILKFRIQTFALKNAQPAICKSTRNA